MAPLPYNQQWSFSIQRQIGQSMVVDAAYIGNKGTRLPHNPQFLGAGYNMNDPKVLGLVKEKITLVHRRLWPALVRLANRFPPDRIAKVRQEHTASGRHVTSGVSRVSVPRTGRT